MKGTSAGPECRVLSAERPLRLRRRGTFSVCVQSFVDYSLRREGWLFLVFLFSFCTGLSVLLSVLLNCLSPGHLMLVLIILTNVSLDISK